MSTIEAAAVSPLFQRIERPRKTPRLKVTAEDRLVDEALAVWAQWFRATLAPPAAVQRVNLAAGSLYEPGLDKCFGPKPRSGVSNPTLAAILADERNLISWPKTIHALITDMPRAHRCVLLGDAMGFTQASVGEYIGVTQPRICVVRRQARAELARMLLVVAHVKRADAEAVRWLERQNGAA
ncbi:MAG TPA: hypothetical protein VFA75_09960 [Nevskia sp.]|nr:hypothetical protein [Nevskia sp.]